MNDYIMIIQYLHTLTHYVFEPKLKWHNMQPVRHWEILNSP